MFSGSLHSGAGTVAGLLAGPPSPQLRGREAKAPAGQHSSPSPPCPPTKPTPLPVPTPPTCSPVSPGFPGKPSRPRSPWQRKRMKRRPAHHGQGHGEASRGQVSDWTRLHSPPGAFSYRTSTHTRHGPAIECIRDQGARAKGQRNQVPSSAFRDRGAATEPL